MRKKINKILSVALAMILVLAIVPASLLVSAATSTVEIGQFKYKLDPDAVDESGLVAVIAGYTSEFTGGDVVFPAEVEYNEKTYKVTGMQVVGYAFNNNKDITSLYFPGTYGSFATFQNNTNIVKVEFGEGIIDINCNMMFYNCTSLTEVILPQSLEKISQGAVFSNCTALESVNLPDSLVELAGGAFQSTGLKEITIPEGITVIQYSTFFECKVLEKVTINGSITSIGRAAFSNCEELKEVEIKKISNIELIDDNAFYWTAKFDKLTMPAGSTVKELGNSAFYYSQYLKADLKGLEIIGDNAFAYAYSMNPTIDFSNVSKIGASAFMECRAYEVNDLLIPNVLEIGEKAFYRCYKLSGTLTLPNVTAIGDYAFEACSVLEKVDLPKVKTLGINAFAYCSELTEIIDLANVNIINDGAFYEDTALTGDLILTNAVSIGKNAFNNTAFNGKVEMPNVIYINDQAFWKSNGGIKELIIPNVIEIGNYAFYQTSIKISELNLPNIIKIGDYAFYNAYPLNSVYIGNSIESIGNYAFRGAGANHRVGGTTGLENGAVIKINSNQNFVTVGTDAFLSYPDSETVDYGDITVEWLIEDDIDYRTKIRYEADAPTLQEAIDAVTEASGTIILEKNVNINDVITIPAGKTIEIKGDFTISPFYSTALTNMFVIENGATLIINGTDINGIQKVNQLIIVNGELILKDGTLSMANALYLKGAVHVNGKFTMEGGEVSGIKSSALLSAAVMVAPGGEFTMTGGTITGNTFSSTRSGAVTVYASSSGNSKFTMNGGKISENTGVSGPGVYVYSQTNSGKAYFEMNDGYVEYNTANVIAGNDSGGGGIMVEGNSSFILNGGYIRHNTVAGVGGGIATAMYSTSVNSPEFTMNGGYVTNNKAIYVIGGADRGCGGGIYIYSHDAKINGGYILDNIAGSQGGGVYVSTTPFVLYMSNALITENYAEYIGGGVWSCPTGTTENFVNNGGAIFDNEAGSAGADLALVNKNGDAVTSLNDRLLGGGKVLWYEDGTLNYNPSGLATLGFVANDSVRFDSENPGESLTDIEKMIRQYALIAISDDNAKELAKEQAKVFISGNKAYRGGGVGTNGGIIIGDEYASYTLTVEKIWDEGTLENERVEITVKLKIGDYELDSVKLNSDNQWKAEFKQLPDPSSLNEADIKVVEVVPTGFYAEYDEIDIDDSNKSIKITVTNHKLTPGTLIIEKEVEGETLSFDEFKFELQKLTDGSWIKYISSASAPDGEFVLSADGSITFTDLPIGATFRVVEINSGNVYTVDYSDNSNGVEIESGIEKTITITNTRKYGSLKIEKVIENFESFDGTTFSFQLQRKDGTSWVAYSNTETDSSGKFTLEAGDVKTFAKLPAGEIFRVVEESTNAVYTVEYSDGLAGVEITDAGNLKITVTNTRKHGSLVIRKVVENAEAFDKTTFTFQLQRKTGDTWTSYSTTGTDSNGRFTVNSGGSVTLSKLPEGQTFRVMEEGAGNIYTVSYSDSQNGVLILEDNLKEITVTNTRKQGSLIVEKAVDKFESFDSTVFSFQLQRKTESGWVAYSVTGTDSNGRFTVNAGSSVTFTKLPVDETFRVVEESTNAVYTVSYSDNGEGVKITDSSTLKITVTNTRKQGSLTVEKVTDKFESFDGTTFSFQLQRRTESSWVAYSTAGTDANGRFTVNAGSSVTFSSLPAGETFRVVEDSTNAVYTVSYSDSLNGLIISENNTGKITVTNTRMQGSLTVEKVIEKFESFDGTTFSFQLQRRDGSSWVAYSAAGTDANGRFTLAGGNSVTFTNLPSGETFRVVEENAGTVYSVVYSDGLSGTAISENTTAKITITNTRSQGKLIITKNVTGGDNGTAFDFVLERKGENGAYTSYVITGKTNSNGIFALKNGESIEFDLPSGEIFRVREVYTGRLYTMVTGSLEAEIKNGQTESMVFVNERNKTSISGTKTWSGDTEAARPDSITVNLYANGALTDKTPVWTKDGNIWRYVFNDLDAYANGQLIEYTVTENPVEGYTTVKNGYNFVNIYNENPEPNITLHISKIYTDQEGNPVGDGVIFYIQIVDIDFNVLAVAEVPANGAPVSISGLTSGEIYAIQEYTSSSYELIGYTINDGELIERDYILFQSILSSENVAGHIYITAHNVGDGDNKDPEEPEWPEEPEEPIVIPPTEVPLGPGTPPTGDTSRMGAFIIALTAGIGTIVTVRSKRKKYRIS